MNNKIIGFIIMIIGIIFGISETKYFGNNLLPGSNAELFCDIISLVIVFCGAYIIKIKK